MERDEREGRGEERLEDKGGDEKWKGGGGERKGGKRGERRTEGGDMRGERRWERREVREGMRGERIGIYTSMLTIIRTVKTETGPPIGYDELQMRKVPSQ